MTGASDLRCYVTLQKRVESENELGEHTTDYKPLRKFWSQIVPTAGRQETIPGDMDRMDITHRIVCRASSIGKVAEGDLRIVYRGQTYTVLYAMPNYKRAGWFEFYCRMVAEDGIRCI